MQEKTHIAHFVVDEKFTDDVITCQGMYPNWDIDYYFVKPSNQWKKFNYVRNASISVIHRNDIQKVLHSKDYKAVFMESIEAIPIDYIPNIDKKIKVFWFAFGYDLYQFPEKKPFIDIPLLFPLTNKEYDADKIKEKPLWRRAASRAKSLVIDRHVLSRDQQFVYAHEALRRIDYFSGVLDYEFDLLKFNNPDFCAKPVRYIYLANEGYHSTRAGQCNSDIMIGNSAAITNNHLDLLPYLKRLNLEGRKVILALSYGGSETYIQKVSNEYMDQLGAEHVRVIKEYLPFNDYMNIINQCGISIYYYRRQQGLGNIDQSLVNGNKVFMSQQCPVYSYFKSIGLSVFSVEEELDNDSIQKPLNKTDIETNRRIIIERNSRETFLNYLTNIDNIILRN